MKPELRIVIHQGDVCLDCPTWRWDEQPHGVYGIERHEDGTWTHDDPHKWRGARIVPVDEA